MPRVTHEHLNSKDVPVLSIQTTPPQIEISNVPKEQQPSKPNQVSKGLKVYARHVQPNPEQRQIHDSESTLRAEMVFSFIY